MIRNMLENGMKISEIAKELNMDRKAVRKYAKSRTIPKNVAEKYLKKWITWAIRTGIPDIVKFGKTLKNHFKGIINAIMLGLNNAVAEGINNKIKTVFKRSYGFKTILLQNGLKTQ